MYSSNQAFTIQAALTDIPKLRQFLKTLASLDKSFYIQPKGDNYIVICYSKEYTLPIWIMQLKRAALLAQAYELELRILKQSTFTQPGLAVMSGIRDETFLPAVAFEAPMFQLAYEGNTALFDLPDTDLKTTDCFGLTILHYALRNIDLVQDIVREIPALVNTPDRHGCTPSMLAAANGQLAALKILKAAGADMQAIDSQGNNALHMAAIAGEIVTMTWLVTEGEMALESQNARGLTPYLWAAQVGQLDVLSALMALGANTKAKDEKQNNALHLAIIGAGDIATIQWLVTETGLSVTEHGVDQSYALKQFMFDETAYAPFLLAASRGQVQVLPILRELGADWQIIVLGGENILHKIASADMLGVCHPNSHISNLALQTYMQLIELLAADFGYIATLEWVVCELQIPLDGQTSVCKKTPFLRAIDRGCLPLLNAFKRLGANLEVEGLEGNSALHIAIESENLATIDWLIRETKIDLEWRRADYKTAFLYAVKYSNLAIVQALRDFGANTTAVDNKNNNALHLAILSCEFSEIEYAYHYVSYKDLQDIEDAWDSTTQTPNTELITWLVKQVKLPLEAKGEHEMTAFLCAASCGYLNTLRLLQMLGANTQVVDANDYNALHLATLKSHSNIIPCLVEEMALDLESQTRDQKTAFLIAVEQGDISVLQVLYNLGANPHAVDKNGSNALDIIANNPEELDLETVNHAVIWLLSEVYANDDRYSTLRLQGELKGSVGDKKAIDALEYLFTCNQAIKTIELIETDLKTSKMNRLIECLIQYQNLTHLDISQSSLTSIQFGLLGIALAENKSLEILRLDTHGSIIHDLDQLLTDGLATHPNLKILDLRGKCFSDQGFNVLVRSLKHNQVLEQLYLRLSLTLKTSKRLQSLLNQGPPLQHIILDAYQNTRDFQCLNTILLMPKVEFSSFTCDQDLTDEEVCQLFLSLTRHAKLATLSITNSQLTKVSLAQLLTALQAWPELCCLELEIQGTKEALLFILEIVFRSAISKLTLHGQCELNCHLQPFVMSIIHITSIRALDLRNLKLADPLEAGALETAIFPYLLRNPYLQELKLPDSNPATTAEQHRLQTLQHHLQTLLINNRYRAATISRYAQGAKRIKSATTKLTSSQPIAVSSHSLFASISSNKDSQESQVENQVCRRPQ